MAKQRKGGEKSIEAGRESAPSKGESGPILTDQAALGNAVLQGRMEGPESESATSQPGLELVASVAVPLVSRAIAALHLDPADAARLARRVEILENSRLPEKDALIDQLHGDEASRMTRDGLVERHFGDLDAQTRRAVDATLDAVRTALSEGAPSADGWVDARGAVAVTDSDASLDVRASALIGAIASDRATDEARAAATEEVGRSTASLVRSLALMILLDEEEDEEIVVDDGWGVETA